jgi:hypothetical protein
MKIIKFGSKVYKINIKVKNTKIIVKETSTYFQRFSYWLLKSELVNKQQALIELNAKISEAWSQYDKIDSEAWSQYNKIQSEAWSQYDKINSEARSQYERKVTIICKQLIVKYNLKYIDGDDNAKKD